MGFRFVKRIKIAPGIRVNISKKGVSSITAGPRGTTVSVGKQGVHGNVGIAGTGLSYRRKLSGNSASETEAVETEGRSGWATFGAILLGTIKVVGYILFGVFILIGVIAKAASK